MRHILKCKKCKRYTLNNSCPECNSEAIIPRPPRYSVEDRMAKYRRLAKSKDLKERGLL